MGKHSTAGKTTLIEWAMLKGGLLAIMLEGGKGNRWREADLCGGEVGVVVKGVSCWAICCGAVEV